MPNRKINSFFICFIFLSCLKSNYIYYYLKSNYVIGVGKIHNKVGVVLSPHGGSIDEGLDCDLEGREQQTRI